MRPARLGTAVAAAGLLVVLATVVAGPALAPAQPAPSTPNATADEPGTLVGVQGVGSYVENGYVARLDGRSVAWRLDAADAYFDASRLPNGSVVAAFVSAGERDCGPYEPPCARTGYQVIDPRPDPRVVGEWSFPVRSQHNSEVHDVEPLPGGGVAVIDMDRERLVVVEDGEITWEWRASERYAPPDDPTRRDWLHMNDVDRIGDGRFLVSVRNANQLVVVERGAGVTEVVNADRTTGDDDACREAGHLVGPDPLCGDEATLHEQHNPQWLGDGAVLVADSENHRVVELHRTNGTWTPAWTLDRAEGRRLDWPRDADRLADGRTLVTDTRNARLFVVDEGGNVTWSKRLDYRTLPYEADRLPAGERVGVPRYATAVEPSRPRAAGGVPVLTPALRALSAAVRLPRWFAELHLVAVAVGVCSVVAGVALRWRS